MEEPDLERLRILYTRIGMVMEDASVIAISLGGRRLAHREVAERKVAKAIGQINQLHEAVLRLRD